MKNIKTKIRQKLQESAYVKLLLLQRCAKPLEDAVSVVITALRKGRSVYLLGNGGSAADAQHIAAELQGRFYKNRKPLPILALTTNTSLLTAVGNDYGYEKVFSRQVEAHVKKGDIVIAISTSGNSPNVLDAIKVANRRGAITIGLGGRTGGKMKHLVKHCLLAPSNDVARIQECHTTMGHILCDVVESELFR